jgi:uncharacterized protein
LEEATELIELLFSCSEIVEVSTVTELCRDPKDNFLLSLAVDGKANFLLTGDTDLLVLGKLGATEIMTYREFLSRYDTC